MTTSQRHFGLLFSALLLIVVFVFRSLLLNISSDLADWHDYPYYVWTIIQGAKNIQAGNIFSWGQANIYYPHQEVLFFSDLLLPQSIFASLLLTFTQNYILIFNILFFFTIALNIFSSIIFWKRFSEDLFVQLFLNIVTVFSPFFFLQLGHFQMLNFWPFLLGMHLLSKKISKVDLPRLIGIGGLITLQFVMSVYLAVFFLWTVGLWFFVQIVTELMNKKSIHSAVFQFITIIGSFVISVSPFLWKYFEVQNIYDIHRQYGEYSVYSAHLTDYFFQPYDSVLSKNLFSGWNKFDLHRDAEKAGWPGFTLVLLGVCGIGGMTIIAKKLRVTIPLSRQRVFFSLLVISGFIFSLGPRLNVNGFYTNIPLPYHIILKLVPLVEPIRATNRWSFLLYFGFVYFAWRSIQTIQHNRIRNLVVIGAIIVYFAEIVPFSLTTESQQYYESSLYSVMADHCQHSQTVILEYPMNNKTEDQTIYEYLTYKTQIMLASLHHQCYLINGYSGFVPKEIEEYEIALDWAVAESDGEALEELLNKKTVSFVKLNSDFLEASNSAQVQSMLSSLETLTPIASTEGAIVYRRDL